MSDKQIITDKDQFLRKKLVFCQMKTFLAIEKTRIICYTDGNSAFAEKILPQLIPKKRFHNIADEV